MENQNLPAVSAIIVAAGASRQHLRHFFRL